MTLRNLPYGQPVNLADIISCFLIFIFLPFRSDREAVIFDIKAYILFTESGKFGFKHICITSIYNVGAECAHSCRAVS